MKSSRSQKPSFKAISNARSRITRSRIFKKTDKSESDALNDGDAKRDSSPVTIMELETRPLDKNRSPRYQRQSDAQSLCLQNNNVSKKDNLLLANPSHFGSHILEDQESQASNSTTEMTMIVPQAMGNAYTVMSHSFNRGTTGASRSPESTALEPVIQGRQWYNLANFKSTLGSTGFMALESSAGWLVSKLGLGAEETVLGIAAILLLFCFFYPWLTAIALGSLIYALSKLRPSHKASKRTVNWTIPDYTNEMRHGFLTCPPFQHNSEQWRLVVCHKRCMDGIQTTFGLIATHISEEVQHVNATIRFSCTNILGQEISPGMKNLKFTHKFECSGDCSYTRPIMFSNRQLGEEDTLNIICTMDFERVDVSFIKYFKRRFSKNDTPGNRYPKSTSNIVQEFGSVQPLEIVLQPMLSVPMQPITRFVQNPETKTFCWEIPSFTLLMKSHEVWGIYSPQFFVNSQDFCSIWRLKLVEVQGVFRLHVQLRGLPRGVNQIKVWHLLQLVDNFGDSVVPEQSCSRLKYPDHMNLWDTTRHILYRRETLLDRFISVDGALTVRLSLQIQPNDLSILEADSDEWICPN